MRWWKKNEDNCRAYNVLLSSCCRLLLKIDFSVSIFRELSSIFLPSFAVEGWFAFNVRLPLLQTLLWNSWARYATTFYKFVLLHIALSDAFFFSCSEPNSDASKLVKELNLVDSLHMLRMYRNQSKSSENGVNLQLQPVNKVFAITSIDVCGH